MLRASTEEAATSGETPDAEVSPWEQLCTEFSDVFAEPGLPDGGAGITHDIHLVDESAPPPRKPAYRMSEAELAEVRVQLQEYLAKGWIRPSQSNFAAPVLFVRKKDGSLRMCIDYRALN